MMASGSESAAGPTGTAPAGAGAVESHDERAGAANIAGTAPAGDGAFESCDGSSDSWSTTLVDFTLEDYRDANINICEDDFPHGDYNLAPGEGQRLLRRGHERHRPLRSYR